MAIIKCKMCGGDLELIPDSTVCECEYCGTRQTVPSADSEKMLSLFHRAGKLLRACEFDKAYGVYESIVAEFPDEAEAYWGLVLCKFGIEYVDDPATGKKVPTCHRAGFESVEDDANFEQACENADAVARRVYRAEGRAIDELRERILEVSGKEEPYDIFISYKELTEDGERTEDSVLAQDIYDALTARGYRVFFSRVTLEDKLGVEYEPYIFAALNSAKVMLLVGMDYENLNAVWVKNEWSRYLALMAQNKEKVLIPCYKDMDPYDLPKEVRKLAAQDMGKVGAMQDLLRGVEKILPLKKPEPVAVPQSVVMSGGPNVTALQKRGMMALEDAQWDVAKNFFDQVLNMDAENAEAWLGLAMADMKLQHESMFSALQNGQAQADGNASYRRFLRFAPPERVQQIQDMVAAAEVKKQKRMAAEAERRAAEEIRRQQEAEAQRQRELKEAIAREARAAAEREARINELKAARERIAPAQGMIVAGDATLLDDDRTIALKVDGTALSAGNNKSGQGSVFGWEHVKMISASREFTVGLRADGRVEAVGNNKAGSCNVSDWRDITKVAAGYSFTAGLRFDGTVLVTGDMHNVVDWKNIVDIFAAGDQLVGLRSDGTVLAVGRNDHGQCNVSDWKDIVSVAVGYAHTVGLKSDGSVLAIGNTNVIGSFRGIEHRCDVSAWRDVTAIYNSGDHTVGLKSDGSVCAVGRNDWGQCNVSNWENVVMIGLSDVHTVGLKADGRVIAVGCNRENQCNVSGWKDIVSIAVGRHHTVGLKSDGTLISTGNNSTGACDLSSWKLFDSIGTLQKTKDEARLKRLADLQAEQETLSKQLPTIKGLFAGSQKAKIEARLAEIAAELHALGAE